MAYLHLIAVIKNYNFLNIYIQNLYILLDYSIERFKRKGISRKRKQKKARSCRESRRVPFGISNGSELTGENLIILKMYFLSGS
ncbi:hypothetical protein B6259_00405 [Ruminococcaceae bacterium CPB6]|nr:hypothetical protein B6259_00405 [Ruminococcaceae bacterium CPB6]